MPALRSSNAKLALCLLLMMPAVIAARQNTPAPIPGVPLAATRSPRMSAEALARLRSYHDHLGATLQHLPEQVSLARVLSPMLALAATRATATRAADELRSSLFVLSFYVNDWSLDRVVPETRGWPVLPARRILLRERDDLTKHFTLSAFIAAEAGGPVAVLAGVYKELRDSRGGSGFSFVDLAADRAGTRFGARATADPDAGRALLANTRALVEDDFMPAIVDLPEGLTDAEFARRFGGVGAPAYVALVDEIDRRLDTLRLFR